MVALLIDELATVKSAFPSVFTHSEALEFHSLFSTVYAPPATEAVCELHRVVVAAWAVAVVVNVSAADAANMAAAIVMGLSIRFLMVMWLILSLRGGMRWDAVGCGEMQ